jgi:hypothetical protein
MSHEQQHRIEARALIVGLAIMVLMSVMLNMETCGRVL